MSTHDLVIRGASLIDGTGAEPRSADVAVSDGIVTEVGEVEGSAGRTIDADGLTLTPGFVDVHSHYDGQASWGERMVPSSWHGVTTVVAGNCGVGFAPVRPSDHQRLIQLMEGVEDIPGVVLEEGLTWEWESFPEFMDVLDGRPFDVDVALQVPHGALRLNVMGERGAARETATPDDIAAMARQAADAIRAGALGFSTSRTLNHRTSTGEPTPTLTAEREELVGIARAIGETGQGVLQVVSDFEDVDDEFDLLRAMVLESGRPLSFSLVQARGSGWRRQLDLLGAANADGIPITAQVAPRAVGLLLGLQCTLQPFMTNPVFREIAGLALDGQVAAMRDPGFRTRLLDAAREIVSSDKLGGRLIGSFDRMYVLGDPPDYEPHPSASFARRADAAGVDVLEMVYDHLISDDGKAFLYLPLLNYADGNLDVVAEMLAHPNTVPGLADGGAHLGTICDASFPTTLLTWWGRDRAEGRLPVPYLVRQHTLDTARLVGLHDRGVVAPGYRADLNLIDLDRLANRPPRMANDLPAGGRRLLQGADGYVATVVAGHVTYEAGEPTGPLPGRLIRGPQPAPTDGGAR